MTTFSRWEPDPVHMGLKVYQPCVILTSFDVFPYLLAYLSALHSESFRVRDFKKYSQQ
jgi:hypothetical protein